MKAAIVSGVILSAILALAPARAQQCPITCTIPAGSTSGTCSNNSAVTCSSDDDCIGAAVAATCPCGGSTNPSGQATPWRNHGQYQSCVAHERNALRKEGCSTAGIASCSARSTCGKPGRVLCCTVASTRTCNGATATSPGTCSNESSVSCTADADCTVIKGPTVQKDAATCTAHGNRYASGTGSVCAGCQPAVACCVPSSTAGQPGMCEVLTASDCTSAGGTTSNSVPSCASVSCP